LWQLLNFCFYEVQQLHTKAAANNGRKNIAENFRSVYNGWWKNSATRLRIDRVATEFPDSAIFLGHKNTKETQP